MQPLNPIHFYSPLNAFYSLVKLQWVPPLPSPPQLGFTVYHHGSYCEMESENKEIIFINDVVSQVLFLSAKLWLITSLDWKTITICAFVMLLLKQMNIL
jgi:hypothetical protein